MARPDGARCDRGPRAHERGCEAARCFEPSARKVLYVHSSAEQDRGRRASAREPDPALVAWPAIFGEGNTFRARGRGGSPAATRRRGRSRAGGRPARRRAALRRADEGANPAQIGPAIHRGAARRRRRGRAAGRRTCGLPVDRDGSTVRLGNASSAWRCRRGHTRARRPRRSSSRDHAGDVTSAGDDASPPRRAPATAASGRR